jgi:hypothetical protein
MKKIFVFKILLLNILFSSFGYSQSAYYFGEFKLRKIITIYDSMNIYTNYMSYSNLYEDSVNNNESWHAQALGNVKYNGVSLKYYPNIRTFMDTVQRKQNTVLVWELSGIGSYPSFTATSYSAFPSYLKTNILPDVLNKSQTFEVNLLGISNAESIELVMFDGTFRTEMPYNRKVVGTTESISIPSADLNTISGTNGVTIILSLVSTEYKMLGGKRFKFEKRSDLYKRLPVID